MINNSVIVANSVSIVEPKNCILELERMLSCAEDILKNLEIKDIDFVFLDGGHSFTTVYEDLNLIYEKICNNKGSVLLCDDYEDSSYITGVKKAVDKFVYEKNLKLDVIRGRFAKIIIQ